MGVMHVNIKQFGNGCACDCTMMLECPGSIPARQEDAGDLANLGAQFLGEA